MKRILSIICLIIAIALQTIAHESKEDSRNIEFKIGHKVNPPSLHRAPIRLELDAYYESNSNTVNIFYPGIGQGEVFIYLDEMPCGYSPVINTSILLPASSGLYKIEIITEKWVAVGYLQL